MPLGVPDSPKNTAVLVVPKAARAMPLAGTIIAVPELTPLAAVGTPEVPEFAARIGLPPLLMHTGESSVQVPL